MSPEYRNSRAKVMKYVALVSIAALIVALIAEINAGITLSSALGISIVMLEFTFLFFSSRRLAGTRIRLEEDAIVEESRGRMKSIRYADVTAVEFPSFKPRELIRRRSLSLLISIISKDVTIAVTGIDNGGSLLLELKKRLDSIGLSDRYDKKRMLMSYYNLQSWQRVLKMKKQLVVLTVFFAAAGFAVGKIGQFGFREIFLFVTIPLALLPFFMVSIIEFLYWRRFGKLLARATSELPLQNPAQGTDLYWKGFLAAGMFFLMAASVVLGIRLSDQNMLWNRDMRGAWNAYQKKDYDRAERAMMKALSRAEKFGPADSRLIHNLVGLSATMSREKKYKEAEESAKRALAIARRNAGTNNSYLIESLRALGYLYYDQERYSTAKPFFEEAIAIGKRGAKPEDLLVLADVYVQCEENPKAEALCKKVIAVLEKGPVNEEACLAEAYYLLGIIHKSDEKLNEAKPLFQKALVIYQDACGPRSQAVAKSLRRLAEISMKEKNFSEAEGNYNRAVDIYGQLGESYELEKAKALEGLAGVYYERAEYEKAEDLHRHVLEIKKKKLNPDDSEITWSMFGLAKDYQAQEKYPEAEKLLWDVLEIEKNNQRRQVPALQRLAELYRQLGRFEEAERHYLQAIAILKEEHGPQDLCVAEGLDDYAAFLRELGRQPEARKAQAEAVAIRAR